MMTANRFSKTSKEVKRKMSGWLIALIIIVALVAAGGICCNTIGKTKDKTINVQNSTDIRQNTSDD